MLINRLMLYYFGKFHNHEIKLIPGINLIYGDNEAGKTTIHTFIKGMLFGIDKLRGRAANSKEDLYTRYLPWGNPGAFHGSMDITIGDREYLIERSFHVNDKSFHIIEKWTGREVMLKEGLISGLIPELTESAFRNTVSIGQLKAHTDAELASQVRNYIANLSVAKSKEVDVSEALNNLNSRKKLLEGMDLEYRIQIQELKELIEEGAAWENKCDELALQLRDCEMKEQNLRKQQEEISAYRNSNEAKQMEQFPALMENYRTYQELMVQGDRLEHQIEELNARVAAIDQGLPSMAAVKEDLLEAEKLRQGLLGYRDLLREPKKGPEGFGKHRLKKCAVLTLGPSLGIALSIGIGYGLHGIALAVSATVLVVGFTLYISLTRKIRDRLRKAQEEYRENVRKAKDLQASYDAILRKYNADTLDILHRKQEEYYESFYALEHGKEQKEELRKRMNEIDDKRDHLYEVIMRYIQQFIREDILAEEVLERLCSLFQQKKQEMVSRQQDVYEEYEECRLQIERLKWELSSMEDNEKQLLNNRIKLEEAERKQKDNMIELEAVRLAFDTIQELAVEIHDSFGLELNKAVSEIIRVVTGRKYKDIKLDENLDIKVGYNGSYLILDKLSAGTIDQIYLALRLAVADLILGEDTMPLLLDDSFALYDEKRVKASLELLSKRKQVILFSCHRREAGILKELNIPFNYIEL